MQIATLSAVLHTVSCKSSFEMLTPGHVHIPIASYITTGMHNPGQGVVQPSCDSRDNESLIHVGQATE